MGKTHIFVDDAEKYLCSVHGPHGQHDCGECCSNLARLLADNEVRAKTHNEKLLEAIKKESKERERMK